MLTRVFTSLLVLSPPEQLPRPSGRRLRSGGGAGRKEYYIAKLFPGLRAHLCVRQNGIASSRPVSPGSADFALFEVCGLSRAARRIAESQPQRLRATLDRLDTRVPPGHRRPHTAGVCASLSQGGGGFCVGGGIRPKPRAGSPRAPTARVRDSSSARFWVCSFSASSNSRRESSGFFSFS